MPRFKTLEGARAYVRSVKVCTVFPSEKTELPSLYENVDLPEKQPGESGWGERVSAVWRWKNQLPAEFPDEIFYGKIKGGFAVLMDLDHLATVHFPAAHAGVETLNRLAQELHEKIRIEPRTTTELRDELIQETGCSKSQFDTALKNLQISLNVVREASAESDTWLPFEEVYTDLWNDSVG